MNIEIENTVDSIAYDDLNLKKIHLDSLRPLPPALVHNLEEWFRIELTYTSNAIEGNTLSRKETALVVEKGLTIGGKSIREHLEAINHDHALGLIHSLTEQTKTAITAPTILAIHSLILKGIDADNAGRYRTVPVRISGSEVVLPNPRKVPDLMEDFIQWLHTSTTHPVELAAQAHYKLVSIHPFVDGNGRTARLVMNLLLLMHGYPAAIIRKTDRLSYITALEKAQLGGPLTPYKNLIKKAVNRSLDLYLKAAQGKPTAPDSDRVLKIGALAKATNQTVPTIRFWTQEGLLHTVDKTASGYALYSHDCIALCQHIRKLKAQRLSLAEIKEALSNSQFDPEELPPVQIPDF
ncbi:MAG: Fic family protein [Candidatus Margulisiibacteriota bacterium]